MPLIRAVALILLLAASARAEAPFSLDPTPSPQPATQATSSPAIPDKPVIAGGLVEFLATRFSALEPVYIIYGCDEPNVKFQISFKYQFFSPEGSLAKNAQWLSGFYLGYSQTTLWNTSAESSPIFDSSYRPEILYLWTQDNPQWLKGMTRFDFQTGIKHESNGESGTESRSVNIAYVQPVFTFGDPGENRGLFLAVAPRAWVYISEGEYNEDIADYDGYCDLRIVTGWRGGFQVSATVRMGEDWNYPTIELEASYPMRNLIGKNLDLYLYAQFFSGYGETLLEYNEDTTAFRVGIALVR